ncbi:MAG: hypothetical protein UT24_C0024G0013 [Candidatus Woesebacteria bacterium GW2011_GWB1_39_12]|uniref:Uncharacterized protein n=1 Tax=Candidatus Woesebacteria bacterium GW2011_GWB1_39_12 TaxID=1618574 RepID=A0A0G0M572_9BACT|nr:MAG: hypothetical protein UT24_C0024G0013 [Candidatus Woesebacteria bacterium GW2011_GWB1_39_12]
MTEHIGLVFAGEQALHSSNEDGVCKYCGRLVEEIRAGYYQCTGYQGSYFKDGQYLNAPRHPLYLDCIKEIRNCGYCQNKSFGFCKRHIALKQFLESNPTVNNNSPKESIESK